MRGRKTYKRCGYTVAIQPGRRKGQNKLNRDQKLVLGVLVRRIDFGTLRGFLLRSDANRNCEKQTLLTN